MASDAGEVAVEIVRTLVNAGHVALLAGGCVRDQLMGVRPKDFDVATSARPEQIRRLFPNTRAVGAAFGVILVRLHGIQTELATFRADGTYKDGRRPETVEFSSPEQDAQRRDFTINGLFYNPLEHKVIDFVAGTADIRSRTLRAIGTPAIRFQEDHLRLLRAVRFAARFDLSVDPATADAIRTQARFIRTIVPERVGDELRKMLVLPSRDRALDLLISLRLLSELLRFACKTPAAADLAFFSSVKPGEPATVPLALAALCHALNPRSDPAAYTRGMRQSLRLSNDETADLSELLYSAEIICSPAPLTLAKKRRLLAARTASDLFALLAVLPDAQPLLPELLALAQQDNAPTPLLSGNDLVAAGHAPGPAFKIALEQTYDAQLEARITTRNQALALAISLLYKP